ncbi:MAG: sigma-54-dependent transcriptional regulator [Planctomycetota bacterium]
MTTELATGRSGTGAPVRARLLVAATTGASPGLAEGLRQRGYDVVECDAAATGCAALAEQHHDLVLVDPEFGPVATAAIDQGIPVLLLTERHGAVRDGCVGHLAPNAAADTAPLVVDLVLDRSRMQQQLQQLETLVEGLRDGSALVGRSPVMRRLQSALSRAADSDATVLVEGAPGSGKTVAARVIHCKSRRGNKPLVIRGAAELDADTMQQVLTQARGSTLLIEDVEQLPQAGQQTLVRFLKERSGGAATADAGPARVVTTTSAHLPELVARGSFREDLYYRLHAYPIVVPALRERVEDIALLAESLLDQIASASSQRPLGFTPSGRILLESMPWPGNVGQLENVVRRAWLHAAGAPIDDRHLSQPAATTGPGTAAAAPMAVAAADEEELSEDAIRPFDEEEQHLLSRALRATRGNVRRAAQLLGIGRATLYRKIQQYKLRLQ